jgi:hypothetical protein
VTRRVCAIVLAFAATTVVACHGVTDPLAKADPGALLQNAVAKTRAAGSASFTVRFRLTEHQAARAHAEGAYDFRRHAGRLGFGIFGQHFGPELEMRMFGPWIYWRTSSFGGGRWARARPSWFGDPIGDGVGTDPTALLEAVVSAAKITTDEGVEEIHGDSVRHVVLAVDVHALARSAQAGSTKLSFPSTLKGVRSPVAADVWIDDAGRFRRFAFHAKVAYFGATNLVDFAIEFRDFGKPVTVDRPPPNDVMGDIPPFGAG